MVYYAPACAPLTHLLHAAPPLPGRDRSRSRCIARSHVPPRCARHHGSTHFRSGSATPWVVQDDSWLFEYVLAASVATVPALEAVTPVVVASGFRVARSEPCAPAPAHRQRLRPDHGTSERSGTHPACAACGPKHQCIACRTDLSPDGAASAPPARASPICRPAPRTWLLHGRLRCGLATPGIGRDR